MRGVTYPPTYNPTANPSFNSSIGISTEELVKRYIPELSAAAGSYIGFSGDVVVGADDDFKVIYQGSFGNFGAGYNADILIKAGDFANGSLFYSSTGNLSYKDSSAATVTVAAGDLSKALHNIVYERINGVVSIQLDGVELGTFSRAGQLTFTRALDKIDGRPAGLELWVEGNKVIDAPLSDTLDTSIILNLAVGGPTLTAFNLTSADTEVFTRYSGYWLGREIITQEIWENPQAVLDQWSFSNNEWSLNGDGANNYLTPFGPQLGKTYRLTGYCSAISGQLSVTTDGSIYIDSIGDYSFTIDTSIAGIQYKRVAGIVSATIKKYSIRESLEIAY